VSHVNNTSAHAALSSLQTALAGRYVFERELGRGGMATVYLAHDTKHDALVALKVLPPAIARAFGTQRFENEIKIAARLQHPHILPILDSGVADDQLWYTMPYVEGESLRTRLERERVLGVDTAVRIARETALALDYAHRKGVIHRDIKPENILLSDGQAIVADFGVAIGLAAADDDRLTETGLAVGTSRYASPEQLLGERHLDGRTDIYALACVLYEMLGGECPFSGSSVQAIVGKKTKGTLVPLSVVRPGIPVDIEQAVVRALSPTPADRFPTAHDFSDALARFAAASAPAVDAAAAPALAAAPRRAGARRTRVAFVGSGLALLVAGGWLIANRHGSAVPPGDRPALAVLPFQVRGQGLDVWREGLVPLFSANLDGAARSRTLSDRTVLSRWKRTFGDADPDLAQALRLAHDLGAQQAITGSLVGSPASVRLVGEIRRTSDAALLSRTQVDGSPDSIPVLVDRMSVELLQSGAMGAAEGLSPKGVGELFTHSLPALKAYLAGEQKLRSFQLERAIPDFQEAVRIDSTFALAFLHLGLAQGWLGSPHVLLPVPNDPLGKARRFSGRLGKAERLAIEGMWQEQNSFTDAIATFRQLTVDRPDDALAWFLLGDALFHLSGLAFEPPDAFRVALEQSAALDPGFGPAYLHLTEAAFGQADSAAVRRYVAVLSTIDSTAPRAVGLKIAQDVVWGDRQLREAALARLDHVSDATALAAKHAINTAVDLSEQTLSIIDRIATSPHHSDVAKAVAELGRMAVYGSLGQLQSKRAALRRAWQLGHDHVPRVCEQTIFCEAENNVAEYLLGAGDSAAAANGAILLQATPDSIYQSYAVDVAWLALRWGNTSVLPNAYRVMSEGIRRSSASGDTSGVRNLRTALRFLRALESRDDSVIMSVFPEAIRQSPVSMGPAHPANFARMELAQRHYARRNYREAERYLLSFRDPEYHQASTVVALWLGKVYEAMGDPKRAADEYAKAAAWWKNADPEIQPHRREALEGLRRTAGELRGIATQASPPR
jgi:serine/threonine-protein kinase